MNDSPVDCQSRRTDRSIYSAEEMQECWFKSGSRNQEEGHRQVSFAFCRGNVREGNEIQTPLNTKIAE